MAGGAVTLIDLTKRFDDQYAVDGICAEITAGEFFSLLGPSGCGKTTTLRMLAGFEDPTRGRIVLDGADVTHLPPNKRPVNTVFQHYALFPFLDVRANVAFGLRYQRCSKKEVSQRVGEALDLVELGPYQRRRPAQLSGGQQQRVALARALVLRPSVLLLDEPLGALDARMRRTLQVELKALQERVGITFIYVTHDQEEALTMSDRIAVMANGRIVQMGSPQAVYDEPADAYVADFLGVSNLMDAVVRAPGNGARSCRVAVGGFELTANGGAVESAGRVRLAIRPEQVGLRGYQDAAANQLPGIVERTVFLGSATQVIVHLAAGVTIQALVANTSESASWSAGTPVLACLPPDALRVLPCDPAAGQEPPAGREPPGRATPAIAAPHTAPQPHTTPQPDTAPELDTETQPAGAASQAL
ncbi:polyamine ABC transporter ATP-binding protein [Trebonia sp.]|uniref:ABC transporter ATP-binding protein n=1 Tax=Trebonia sp. TaxID=2767075 RepID=UPI0026264296|nr:polyamine ABC transporter ATP-binding protein [Trebonia sp.]